jgi:hypothetical protein
VLGLLAAVTAVYARPAAPGGSEAADVEQVMTIHGDVLVNEAAALDGILVEVFIDGEIAQQPAGQGDARTTTAGGEYEVSFVFNRGDEADIYVEGVLAEPDVTCTFGIQEINLAITKAHLVVDITSHDDGDAQSTEQVFDVVAVVENTGLEDAHDVEVAMTVDGADILTAPGPLGAIEAGASKVVTWTLECTEIGDTPITVDVSGTTPDFEGGWVDLRYLNLEPDTVTIVQEEKIHLTVTDVWTDLPNETIASTEQVFHVMATVKNARQAGPDVPKAWALDVLAELEVVSGSVEILSTPDPFAGPLKGDETYEFVWEVKCTGAGDVAFLVTPSGIDENTGEQVLPDNIDTNGLDITQELKLHLTVLEVWSDLIDDTASTKQNFHVMAKVENQGEAVGEDVMAELTATGLVDIGDAMPESEDFLEGTEVVTFTWPVTCTGIGDVEFTVTPSGIDENTLEQVLADNVVTDTYTILQEEKAHLAVTGVWTDLIDDTASTEQTFHVMATVKNERQAGPDVPKANAEDVTAALSLVIDGGTEGTAAINPLPEPASVDVVTGSHEVTFTWTVTCTGAGDVAFLVTPSGIDENTQEPVLEDNIEPGGITVHQEEKLHLKVLEVWSDLIDDTASTEQHFHVMATVENLGEAVGEDVMAELTATAGSVDIGDPMPASQDFLAQNEVVTFTWPVTCTGAGEVVFLVTPSGIDENTREQVLADNIETGELSIMQETKSHLVATLVSSLIDDTASTEQTFYVTATVENQGQAVAEHVIASLTHYTGSVELLNAPTMPTDLSLAEGETHDFVWEFKCTGPDEATFVVTPSGIDENTQEPVLEDNIEPGRLTVTQELKAHLKVEILEPLYGQVFSSDQEFTVMAVISNTGEADALDVKAVLEPLVGDGVLVNDVFTKTVPIIAGGETEIVTWTVRCTGSEQVHLEVNPYGVDENTMRSIPAANREGDLTIVNQEWKAHLTASISSPTGDETFTVGDTFVVTATVENTGEADALNASATIMVEGAGQLVAGQDPTYDIGMIAGDTTSDPFSWDVECTGSGPVTITVMPAGVDENTKVAITADALDADSVVAQQELERGTLVGQVMEEGRPAAPDARWEITVTVKFMQGGSLAFEATADVDQSGVFTVTDVVPGTYDVLVKNFHTLAQGQDGLEVLPGETTAVVDFGTLYEGDGDDDNDVDFDDLLLIGEWYESPTFQPNLDFNNDGVSATFDDLLLLAANYEMVGDPRW